MRDKNKLPSIPEVNIRGMGVLDEMMDKYKLPEVNIPEVKIPQVEIRGMRILDKLRYDSIVMFNDSKTALLETEKEYQKASNDSDSEKYWKARRKDRLEQVQVDEALK